MLEVRALQTAQLGALIGQFDDGMVRMRRVAHDIAKNAFSADLPDHLPLIDESGFDEDLQAARNVILFIISAQRNRESQWQRW